MKARIASLRLLAAALTLGAAVVMVSTPAIAAPARPKGPCDIYAAAGDPCVAAHSTTRALYAAYSGPLYQVLRQTDGKTLDIGVVQPSASDAGGYANAAAQDAFCANTYCWIATIYDQSGKHNDLTQPPRGGFSGPAMGGFDNVPIADMAPVTVMGHKVYGVFIEPGMGLRIDDAKGTAVDDQAEGQYWVINGRHFNSGCCFDYGNAETDSRDDGNGTMETAYYGDSNGWYHGNGNGPWVMTDQENNLVGCVNADGSKLCSKIPNIDWRFVTAIAKGEAHHWTSLGGDAQRGDLAVMFDGQRVNSTYDPMRKQGAILLGNGGDNSNSSQGTFYEGAMTAGGTFPNDATDQLVQANVVAAAYDVQPLSLAPASAGENASGLQTFVPGQTGEVVETLQNTSGAAASGVKLGITAPKGWIVAATGSTTGGTVASGAVVSETFKVTSAATPFDGDLVATASWSAPDGRKHSETATEKVRNVSPVKINEFSTGTKDSFIELYNAGVGAVDLSNWTLTEHAAQQAIFSTIKVPAGTKLASRGFYLLGLSSSGLAVPARAGDSTLFVRSVAGMKVGDSVEIGGGAVAETRKIASIGGAASSSTTLWQPLPDGPVITIAAGANNVPVTSVAGFEVGQKIALGHGATYPAVARDTEQYEVATVTAISKPGTQAYLGADAAVGSTNIKVTSVANITAGDKIRLDIDSVGHGIETVTVTHVGTQSSRAVLTAEATVGATRISVRSVNGFTVGDKVTIGGGANASEVTISGVGGARQFGAELEFTPALAHAHAAGDAVLSAGTGVDISSPLRFAHAANMPFSDRGTGITFSPATAFAHSSNEPVQGLGVVIVIDSALAGEHAIDAPIRDAGDTMVGYPGTPVPNQWFGGPVLSPAAGSIVLRDAGGLVVDSLNYGLLVDPWAGEGYQATSGEAEAGCRVISPSVPGGGGRNVAPLDMPKSAGRFPDGADGDSNCTDFMTQAAATLAMASAAGATNIKVGNVEGFGAGQKIMIDLGANQETATIATVGTAGATTIAEAVAAGSTSVAVANAFGFRPGQTIAIDSGADAETAVVAEGGRRGAMVVMLAAPLVNAHAAGAQVSGTGITLTGALGHAHAGGAAVMNNLPTPGGPNQYASLPSAGGR